MKKLMQARLASVLIHRSLCQKREKKKKEERKKVYVTFKYFISRNLGCLPGGLVVRIRGSHPRGPGSIPGLGKVCIDGSVVESSPATRGARVRFPVNADI